MYNLALSFNQPKIQSNATWCKNGITFVDISTIGGEARGFFVDSNNTIFVAAQQKSQILIWSKESIIPVQTISVKLPEYPTLFVPISGDIYFENGKETGRVGKWITNLNDSTFVTKFSNKCFGLFIDTNNTLYCSLRYKNQVVKKSLDDQLAAEIIVAGTGHASATSNALSEPWGIFVNINFYLYVADAGNHRIQLFQPGQRNGITVAGNGIPQSLSLNFPTDVILDADGYLYIADNHIDRVIRSGYDGWECVIGCSGKRGSAPNELHNAYSIRFDSDGNLYIADEYNNRIQKFTLETNFCETSATTMPTVNYMTSCSSTISTVEPPQQSTSSSVPSTCSGIGPYCNISDALCDMLKPCQNDGVCQNTSKTHYFCICPSGFNGKQCEVDSRPCKPNTCWNNGTCNIVEKTKFICLCKIGWEGTHCEKKVNYCQNVTCQNKGVCEPSFMNFTCRCLGDNYYSGRYCEIKAKRIIIFTIVSKSCGYIAILVIIATAMFIVIMDILKYCFGIDLTRKELEEIRREKRAKKRKPVIQRFVYVNALPTSNDPNPIVEETVV